MPPARLRRSTSASCRSTGRPHGSTLRHEALAFAPMRMRQSLAQFEEAFREEAAESIVRRERLRKEAAQRSRVRRVERTRKQGSLRFTFLALSIVVTAVIVTIVMFETLAMLAG